ncbi:hypothetical protein SGLAM104S_03908 [Streptomyces glaucescens]|jgi:hypothetical protein
MPPSDLDGGLPPGGAPGQCGFGPCPVCSEDRQMSSACFLQSGHGGDHRCPHGDVWEQSDPGAAPQRKFCGSKCPEPGCGKTCTRQFIHETPHMCPLGHTW